MGNFETPDLSMSVKCRIEQQMGEPQGAEKYYKHLLKGVADVRRDLEESIQGNDVKRIAWNNILLGAFLWEIHTLGLPLPEIENPPTHRISVD